MNLRPLPVLPLLALTVLHAAEFPAPHNSEQGNPTPIAAADALAQVKLPPGFQATLFASEPEVQNPIALSFDARGRLWIAENYTYAERTVRLDLALRDRILILEDADGDGRADGRKVFTDSLQVLTGFTKVPGGVWAICPPQLVFIPDADGDDVPDAAPRVVLDGFTVPKENHHNFANGLSVGPDGWIYGRCGASSPGEIGAPGTPAAQRVPMRGGLWRYHPERRIFEALTHGTTNPWGHDWDARGELFYVNTVNGHFWHMIPGAHFTRPHTRDPHPHAYALIDTHADHYHFDTGKGWMASRDGASNDLGGGHSHQGALIYQGDNWPAEYRGKFFTLNLHGRRVNTERLERRGSGFVARHEPDFALWGDAWFRGIDLATGPDGGVFVLDWSDTGECHENTGVHRTSGRIYKITHGQPARPAARDLAKASPAELVALHRHENEWFARAARAQLAARSLAGGDIGDARATLTALLESDATTEQRLRALWTLRLIGGTDDARLTALLDDKDEHVRTWAIRLLTDGWPLELADGRRPARDEAALAAERLAKFAQLAREDSSGLVRLVLASTLQRLPVARRADLAAPLLARAEDAQDHNLPVLVWFGVAPLGESDPAALVRLAGGTEWPLIRRHVARRLAAMIEKSPAPLNALLALAADQSAAFQTDILAGLGEGFTGWRKAPKPDAWDPLLPKLDPALAAPARELSALFGDGRALEEVKRVALDPKAEMTARQTALQTLVEARPPDLRALCEKLLGTRFLNTVAIRGLAQESDPAIAAKLIGSYRSFAFDERSQVIATLVARPAWAAALLDAIANGKLPRTELSAFHARQIRHLNDPALDSRLTAVWGELRESAADKQARIAKMRAAFTPDALAQADPAQGRVLYQQLCAACHTLYGEGGKLGPDLTGSGRSNLDYLLENIVDPSAVVTADFRLTTVTLKDGRVLAGVIAEKTDRTLTLRTMTDTQTLERAEIAKLEESPQSMMPEGLVEALPEDQVRALFAYLMGAQQVPLPAAK